MGCYFANERAFMGYICLLTFFLRIRFARRPAGDNLFSDWTACASADTVGYSTVIGSSIVARVCPGLVEARRHFCSICVFREQVLESVLVLVLIW